MVRPAGAMKFLQVDFLNPPGEPAMVTPDSPWWRVMKNPLTSAIGAVTAVIYELADPRIRSGVWDHSIFKKDPILRGQRTRLITASGYYAPASTARRLIDNVTRMHSRVNGNLPNGEPYKALTPELLDWVQATANYGYLNAYARFVKDVSEEDRKRFYRDDYPVGACYGVVNPLNSDADFFTMLDKLFPGFEPHEENVDFMNMLVSSRTGNTIPQFAKRAFVRASVSLVTQKVRDRIGLGKEYDMTVWDKILVRTLAFVAEHVPAKDNPARLAAIRLGLPANFAWLSPAKQRAILDKNPAAMQPATPAVPMAAE